MTPQKTERSKGIYNNIFLKLIGCILFFQSTLVIADSAKPRTKFAIGLIIQKHQSQLAVLPKPMSRPHLLKLILQAAQSLKPIFNKPMLLCSESEFKDADIAPYFEAAIPKMPSDLKTLMENMVLKKLGKR